MTDKDFALPIFDLPSSVNHARQRITELNVAISSINDQINFRELSNSLDPNWMRGATTSRRYKTLERDRLQDWIDNQEDVKTGKRSLNDAIVDILRDEYNAETWQGIVDEANELLMQGN